MSKFSTTSVPHATALLITVCVAFFVACDLEVTSEEIALPQFVGTYVADFSTASMDIIVFRVDSTYVHLYQKKDSCIVVDSGLYEFAGYIREDRGIRTYTVNLANFLLLTQEEICPNHTSPDSLGRRMKWLSLGVRKTRDMQRIELCPGESKYYVKVK